MKSRRFLRALATGAGLALVVLVAWLLLRGESAPQQGLPKGFDSGQFTAGRPRLDAPFVATDTEVVDAMLGLARVRPGERVVDLGSGDGRILIAAARSHGAGGLGVDIDPERVRESIANARAAGVSGRVQFRRQDLFETPLDRADVITLYLSNEVNLQLRERLLEQARPGTRIVSHDFDMGEWRPDGRQRVGTSNVYLWIVPARVEGRWLFTVGERSIPIALDQQFQSFFGTATVGDRQVRIEQGTLAATAIRFIADLGAGRRAYEGRVEGDTIVPTTPRAPWRMTRAN